LFPSSWKKLTFVTQTLEMFPQLQTYEIPFGKHLFVKNLVMPEVKPWTPMFIPEQIVETRELLVGEAEKRNISESISGNTYLSRKDSSRKNLSNEKEVISVLQKYNFGLVEMSKLSIFEQVSLMNNTKNLVSITGAGMANFIFLNKNSSVIDLTNVKYLQHKQYKFHFWKLCNILNIRYFVQFCEHENDPNVPRYSLQNLMVDTQMLEDNLKIIIN